MGEDKNQYAVLANGVSLASLLRVCDARPDRTAWDTYGLLTLRRTCDLRDYRA